MPPDENGADLSAAEDTAAVLAIAAGQRPDASHDEPQNDQPGADAAAETGEAGEGEQPQPKRTSVQDRIDELTRDKHAERRRAEALERELAQFRAQAPPQPQKPANTEDAEPDPGQFQFGEADPAFIRQLARHEARQAYRAEAERHQQQTRVQSLEQTWTDRQQAFAKDNPDYFDALDREWVCTPVMADAIKTSDEGARVAYHLAQHPDEARRISGLNPLAQVRELGRLEATLATPPAEPAPQLKTVSDAPAPHPQSRGLKGQFKPPADTSDFAAFERAYTRRDG